MAAVINSCIVGFGMSAQIFHAPFLMANPGFNWMSVVERSTNKGEQMKPGIITFRDFEEAIQHKTVDLIIITTPNETHFPFAKRALEAGKHVVVEKPFTNNSEEAKELIEAANRTGKVLSVYQNRRYVSDFLTIKKILAGKWLGGILEFEGHFDRYRPDPKPNAWREEEKPGSGILYDLGSHLIDQALCLFGLPRFIQADICQQRPHAKVDDYFEVRLYYGTTKVILKAGMLVREPGPRYMIHGTKGSFIKNGEDPQEASLKKGMQPTDPQYGMEEEKYYGLLHTEKDGVLIKKNIPSEKGNFGLYYSNLYDSIVNKAPITETAEHGFNTIRLIELALESNKTGCKLPCEGLIPVAY